MIEATGCGHKTEQSKLVVLATKHVGYGNCRSVRYGSYCPQCAKEQIENNNVLVDNDEQSSWLMHKMTS